MFCSLLEKLLPKNSYINNKKLCDNVILSSALYFVFKDSLILSNSLFYTGIALQSIPLSLIALYSSMMTCINTNVIPVITCAIAILPNIITRKQVYVKM